MCVQWEGYECGETIGFCTLTHLFPLQKGFTYHSPKGWYRFVDVILATHQHYNDQLCLQLLLQPSLAKLKTVFYLFIERLGKEKSKSFPRHPDSGKFNDTFLVIGSLRLSSCHHHFFTRDRLGTWVTCDAPRFPTATPRCEPIMYLYHDVQTSESLAPNCSGSSYIGGTGSISTGEHDCTDLTFTSPEPPGSDPHKQIRPASQWSQEGKQTPPGPRAGHKTSCTPS